MKHFWPTSLNSQCIAHGETREEALQNALIAIENWIDTAQELKREIPENMRVPTR